MDFQPPAPIGSSPLQGSPHAAQPAPAQPAAAHLAGGQRGLEAAAPTSGGSNPCAGPASPPSSPALFAAVGHYAEPMAGAASSATASGLPADLHARLARATGDPLADIRVHKDGLAEERCARGLAIGTDIHLASDVDLASPAGQQVVSHEVVHVLQQRGATGSSAGALDMAAQSGGSAEQEADALGERALRGESIAGTVRETVSTRRPQHKPRWEGGPTSTLKSKGHTLAEYVGWLQQVEAVYGANKEAMLHRLRRLYYSKFTGGVGPKFDQVISPSGMDDDAAPMTSPPVPLEALNGLYETNFIITPRNTRLDVSHLFAGLDVEVSGTGFKADVGAARYGVDWGGVLTWAGDLASWFVEWKSEVKKATDKRRIEAGLDWLDLLKNPMDPRFPKVWLNEQQKEEILLSIVDRKVSKDDLIGDMDAQSMTKAFTDLHVIQSGEGAPPVIYRTLTASLSEMLLASYTADRNPASTRQDTPEQNRFAYFVKSAQPRIPHSEQPGGTVQLAPDAKSEIHQAIRNTADLFTSEGYFSGESDELARNELFLWKIAWYFENFLKTGLAHGDAAWPR